MASFRVTTDLKIRTAQPAANNGRTDREVGASKRNGKAADCNYTLDYHRAGGCAQGYGAGAFSHHDTVRRNDGVRRGSSDAL